MMANQSSISNGNAALILKTAAAVNKNPFANGDIFPKIRVERGKHRKALIDRLANELFHQPTDFFR